MKTDRFLTGILIGIGVLIVLALALFFLRREQVDYRAEDAPDGVVHNYILAIERQDYERAYSYLADRENKPSYSAFRAAFIQKQIDPGRSIATIGETEIFDDEAVVGITITRGGYGLFADPYSDVQSVLLVRQNDTWKIEQAPWPYWGWDWFVPQKLTP
jgi:ABC-type amino acid transport substrate-binding protein